jgi:hypothetical protein
VKRASRSFDAPGKEKTSPKSHHSCGWLTLGPYQARTMRRCDWPNDARLRLAERCTDAIRRTMHGCDMLSELPSIGIDHSISRYRRSRTLYTRSYLPSQTGQNPPRARLQANARAQNCRKCASGTFLPLGRSVSKVKPRVGVKRHLCMMLPPWPGAGDAELMRMPGISRARRSSADVPAVA